MNKRIKKKQWTMWNKQHNKRWKKYCQRVTARYGCRPHHPVIKMLECERVQAEIEKLSAIIPIHYATEIALRCFKKEVK